MGEDTETRIFTKLESISTDLAVVKSQLPDARTRIEDHEKRLRSLEVRLWYAAGAIGLFAFALPEALNRLGW